jgi:hypothetical protein
MPKGRALFRIITADYCTNHDNCQLRNHYYSNKPRAACLTASDMIPDDAL